MLDFDRTRTGTISIKYNIKTFKTINVVVPDGITWEGYLKFNRVDLMEGELGHYAGACIIISV